MENNAPILKPNTKTTSKPSSVFFQPKLTINTPGDRYEQEADDMAERVMAKSGTVDDASFFSRSITPVQRKCAHCEEEEKLQRKKKNENENNCNVENYVGRLSSVGESLPNDQRSFFECRFGIDFSQVKIHTDNAAVKSAKSIGALAYTSGNNIVFNEGQYAPGTLNGDKLMAHELTHVIQQKTLGQSSIQRYSDTDHHILEEVALSDIFSEAALKNIEHGNTQRDYSQLPAVGSALLIGEPHLGGYEKHEHFDNFIFDRETDRWVSHSEYSKMWDDKIKEWIDKPVTLKRVGRPTITPLQYIESQLKKALQKDVPDAGSFTHLGNAFHTIEDFFAHSNFVELTKGDFSFGKELTTHAPGVPGAESTDSILGNVLDPAAAIVYKEKFQKGYETGSSLSHGKLAKDFHVNPNHLLAMTLTVLVIREIAMMMKQAMTLQTKAQRMKCVEEIVMPTIADYLRPPDDKNKWWEKLIAQDAGRTAEKIRKMEENTPVTINQTLLSPLRNLEATKFSNWKAIGLGTSFSVPLKNRTFFTAGYMLYAPGTGFSIDDKLFVAPRTEWDEPDRPALIFGAQVSGSFDLTNLIHRKK